MAQGTAITLSLQARDWEAVIGIISYNTDPQCQELVFALNTFVKAAALPKPSGSTVVPIVTTEYMVWKIAEFLYGSSLRNSAKDVGASTFTRVMTAVRAANNPIDNYINTQLAVVDANNATAADNIRKNGREVIMMSAYDNT